ncbi:MAG: hypothetical protein WDA16_13310 [Candidatus Thermoplasmatota archaeon]
MAVSRPLLVAVACMVLLLGSVTFEVVFHRTFTVEVHDAVGWQTVGSFGTGDKGLRAEPVLGTHAVTVNRSDNVEFRVRVDNAYPLAYSHSYVVGYQGINVGEGTLTAPARDVGTSSFTIPASTLLTNVGPKTDPRDNITFVYFDVRLGNIDVPASFQLQEVSR